MTYTVRPISRLEVEAAVAVVRDVLVEFGVEFGWGSETDGQMQGLPDSYLAEGGLFFVALDEFETVIGTAGVFPIDPGVFELRKMYIRPSVRGRGVGTLLFEECLHFCRQNGAHQIVLGTRENMVAGIAFYEQKGFVRDDAQKRSRRTTRGYRLDLAEALDSPTLSGVSRS